MSSTTAPSSRLPEDEGATPTRVSPWLLWFGTLGGIAAWSVHLLVSWSVLELACNAVVQGPWVDRRAGDPGTGAWIAVVVATGGPWLVAAASFACCLLLRRRQRRLVDADDSDELAQGRIALLVTLGIFLNLFALAAITGGIVALLTLETCG